MENEEYLAAERVKKQMFLKSEILDEGYSGQDFAEFLDNKKPGGGANVDLWTTEELVMAVSEFKSEMAIKSLGQEDDYAKGYQEPAKKMESSQPKPEAKYNPNFDNFEYDEEEKDYGQVSNQSSNVGSQGKLPEKNVQFNESVNQSSNKFVIKKEEGYDSHRESENFSQRMNVRIGETTQLTDKPSVTVTVVEPELVKGGIFSSSYIAYKIKTAPFGWTVRRKYSDFVWLRNTLNKLHPGVALPPCPKKKSKGKFENDKIRKRMYFLEHFVNACLQQIDLKSDRYLQAFLQVEEDSAWKSRKKEGEKVHRIQKLEDIYTTSGQINLEINNDLKIFCSNAFELANQTEPIYQKIRKLSKQLVVDMDQVSNTIFTLGECFAALYGASSTYNKNVNVGRNPQLDDMYLTLNNMMVSWGEQMLSQIKLVQKHFTYFYKYATYENEGYKELLKIRNAFGIDYVKKKKEVNAKKEAMFQKGDPSKWEISASKLKEYSKEELLKNKSLAFDLMLPKETASLNELRDLFAYYNSMSYTEVTRTLGEKCRNYCKNFSEFAKSQGDNLSQMHVSWSDMMSHFTEVKNPGGKERTVLNRNSVWVPDTQYDMGEAEDD